MAWTAEQQKALVTELQTDPLGAGYTEMSDAEVADYLNAEVWPAGAEGRKVDPWKIYHVMTSAELLAWYTAAQSSLELKMQWELFMAALQANHAIDPMDVDMPGIVDAAARKTLLQRLFGAGSKDNLLTADTVDKIEALTPKVSRRQLLGIPPMTSGWVAHFREVIRG